MFCSPLARQVDIYAIGVIMWEVLTRAGFFAEKKFLSQIENAVVAVRIFFFSLLIPQSFQSIDWIYIFQSAA
jgi:hypothetical protein